MKRQRLRVRPSVVLGALLVRVCRRRSGRGVFVRRQGYRRSGRFRPGVAMVGCGLAILLSGSRAEAQNLRDVPSGGRTGLMGGAGVAAGADAAMPYLNPAGVVGTPHDLLSLSATVYAYTWTRRTGCRPGWLWSGLGPGPLPRISTIAPHAATSERSREVSRAV